MPQTECSKDSTVHVSSGHLILTPFAGASLVNEILKGVLYQKCQIPFPFTWLKQVVEKRRNSQDSEECEPKKINFTHENHYRTVSSAYDSLELIMKSITKEFCEIEQHTIKEMVVVFGPSPHCPNEAFSVVIPSIAREHIERNHIGELNKHLQKVLRSIFLSQTWLDSIRASFSCTNTYIYLKKHVKTGCNFSSEAFEVCEPLELSSNIKHLKYQISYEPTERTNCCKQLLVFDDSGSNSKEPKEPDVRVLEEVVWCRSKEVLKGFKDNFVNKVSVCELW